MVVALLSGVWSSFLADRAVDLERCSVVRLEGGEVNHNWKITDRTGQSLVLRHYQITDDDAEIDCELGVAAYLATAGFPTPAPVGDHDGRVWARVEDRPAVLFTFAAGTHPPQRAGGYGSLDLQLGRRAARIAGLLHTTLATASLPGRRAPGRDPWRRLGSLLTGPFAGHDLLTDLIPSLRSLQTRLAPLYAEPNDTLPWGFIHNDITPNNLLLDPVGDVAALIDFDDSAQTFLVYEIGAIAQAFAKDENRRLDPLRVASVIAAYHAVRPLTPDEIDWLPDLLAVHAAAQGLSVVSNWLKAGRKVTDPFDSFSLRAFADLDTNLYDYRHQFRDALARI